MELSHGKIYFEVNLKLEPAQIMREMSDEMTSRTKIRRLGEDNPKAKPFHGSYKDYKRQLSYMMKA